jgi:hypothetical protein
VLLKNHQLVSAFILPQTRRFLTAAFFRKTKRGKTSGTGGIPCYLNQKNRTSHSFCAFKENILAPRLLRPYCTHKADGARRQMSPLMLAHLWHKIKIPCVCI